VLYRRRRTIYTKLPLRTRENAVEDVICWGFCTRNIACYIDCTFVVTFEHMLITIITRIQPRFGIHYLVLSEHDRIANRFLDVTFEGKETAIAGFDSGLCEETLMSDIRYMASRLVLLVAELDIDCGAARFLRLYTRICLEQVQSLQTLYSMLRFVNSMPL
jgi:hypothetical protein